MEAKIETRKLKAFETKVETYVCKSRPRDWRVREREERNKGK